MAAGRVQDPVRSLCISGGTHGNELHGVYMVRNWMKSDQEIKRDSFRTHVVLTNQRATDACVRYIDVDLNRQVTAENLFPVKTATASCPYEVQRARELHKQFQDETGGKGVDVWVDLHNTTSNTGPFLILSKTAGPLPLHIASQVQAKFPGTNIRVMLLEGIFETTLNPHKQENAGSTFPTASVHGFGKEGICVEMGPLAHGTLNAKMFNLGKQIILSILDIVDEYNKGKRFEVKEIEVFNLQNVVHFPTNASGEITALISPDLDGKDWNPLQPGDPVFLTFSGETLPYKGEAVVWPTFINEAAYFCNKIAFALTSKEKIVVPALQANK